MWAPDAERVSVIGSFNDWKQDPHLLSPRGHSGIWEGFIPGIGVGTLYKYHVRSRFHGYRVDKTDPLSFFNEIPPKTASIVWDLAYEWNDADWMRQRTGQQCARRRRCRSTKCMSVPGDGCRGGQPFPQLSRDGRAAGGICQANGIHACRVSAR